MIRYLRDNAWVWAGTSLVLLTLSGATFRIALIISIAAAVLHLLFSVLSNEGDAQ